MTTVYFLVALVNDFCGSNEIIPEHTKIPLIRKIRDFIFSSVALTTSCGVLIFFWIIYSINKRFIFVTQHLIDIYPIWYNNMIHTFGAIVMIIEMFWTHHKFMSNIMQVFCKISFIFCYNLLILFIYEQTGAWVYPFMGLMSFCERNAFFAFALVCAGTSTLVMKSVNNFIWKSRVIKANNMESENNGTP